MNVFVDQHHGDLFYSLQLLFEKRLGCNLYRPIGMDWFIEGFWKIGDPYPDPSDTAKQYLNTTDRTWDPYKNLNGNFTIQDGIYNVWDPVHRVHQKAITLEKFKEMEIDIVISSYQPHDTVYASLISQFKPKAKHIAQMGNIFQTTEVTNVMCSTAPYEVPSGKNVVFYHQEFSLEAYKYLPPTGGKRICSFVNLLPKKEMFELYKISLPEFDWRAYGAGCPNGTISSDLEIGKLMSESMFGYHVKPGGDGFGHIIHNWFACGRPMIVSGNDYRDKLAGKLLIDGETCIDIDRHSFSDILALVRECSHERMSENAYRKFKEIVDYGEEERKIRNFLNYLI